MLKFKILLMMFALCFSGGVFAELDIDNYQALTSDRRSFRVGEPLVILVVEATTAESSAGTGVSKNIDINASAFDNVKSVGVGLDVSGSDDSAGQTVRRGRATTQLSAIITEVLPNKLYRITGKQHLVVNGEKQKITLSGLVRQDDISKNNTLMSNRIADAEIEIDGVGDVSDAQNTGLIYKVFQWLGIF